MSRTLTIRLDDDLAQSLEKEVRRTNRSRGRILSDALKEHLRTGTPNALDRLRKYVGIIEGPADLSTNKKYLAGLGNTKRR
jgi:metal-responsive CopG/Arc/MetJ family transcriptional regulator